MSYAATTGSTALLISLLIGSGAAQSSSPLRQTSGVVEIDHIIVAISNLQEGTRKAEEMTGVRPIYGGRHPGAGTENALMALGLRVYLEILAPQPDVELPETLAWLLDLNELTPMGFAVSTTDVAATVAWLQNNGYVASVPTSGSRSRPDGATLQWTSLDITEPELAGAPFFIRWDASSPHPATTSPEGCVLRSLTVVSPERDALGRLFNVLGLEIVVEGGPGPEAAYEVALHCPKGPVVLK